MGPTWVLSATDGPHVGPVNLAIRDLMGIKHSLAFDIEQPLKSYSHYANLVVAWDTRAPSQYKDRLSRYGDSHVKDKAVAKPSYL